ncbi:MAG: radical SAM protein [Ignavibacteriales bacterium]|nr:radical SAM protein [Ignavibacteriales bacterium]
MDKNEKPISKPKAFFKVIADYIRIPNLKRIAEKYDKQLINLVANNRTIRKVVMGVVRRRTKKFFFSREDMPVNVRKEQYAMALAVLKSVERFIDSIQNKTIIKNALINNIIPAVSKVVARKPSLIPEYEKRFNNWPPGFLTIAPTGACNLRCAGCYANSDDSTNQSLDFDVLDKIIQQKKELWGSWFTVLTGGEPFIYKSKGKTLLDLVEKHPDQYFMVYTNGTLLTDEVVERMAKLGNISPAISVEGYEEETDERRGKGTYQKILEAYERLKRHGVPFGVSVTAFKHNVEKINQELFDTYLKKHGAFYMWIFQYMPIGREQSLDMLITPEQRLDLYNRTNHAVKKEGMFIADFWNSGIASYGCISAGTGGGYFYIDWNGNVTPCTFVPYSHININKAFEKDMDLNDVVEHGFMKDVRQWQKDYALEQPPDKKGNWFRPCPIRDHYEFILEKIKKYDAKPIDKSGQDALEDENYQKGMVNYGNDYGKLTDPIWEKEMLNKS